MRKIILYTAMSIDGFIAREDGNIDWLLPLDNENNDEYGYYLFNKDIDITLMGRKTYEQILTFPGEFSYADKINYVFSHEKQQSNKLVHFINDNIIEFINQLKDKDGKNIWLTGGEQLNTTLLNHRLIDEIILTIIPIILGKGIPLFGQQSIEQQFKHSETKTFSNGCVQIKYIK